MKIPPDAIPAVAIQIKAEGILLSYNTQIELFLNQHVDRLSTDELVVYPTEQVWVEDGLEFRTVVSLMPPDVEIDPVLARLRYPSTEITYRLTGSIGITPNIRLRPA